MTKARDLANIISGGFTADDIPNLDASKITSGTFADARISQSSVVAHSPQTDLQPIKSDISALALREATNESSAAFNLPNQFIDTFSDDTKLGTQTTVDRVSGYIASVYTQTTPAYYYLPSTDQWNFTMPSTASTGAFTFAAWIRSGDGSDWTNQGSQGESLMALMTDSSYQTVFGIGGGGTNAGKLVMHTPGLSNCDATDTMATNGATVSDWVFISARSSNGGFHRDECELVHADRTDSALTTHADSNGGSTASDYTDSGAGKLFYHTSNSYSNAYHGEKVARIGFWNECLTAAEVLALHNGGKIFDWKQNKGNYTSSANLDEYFAFDATDYNSGNGTTLINKGNNLGNSNRNAVKASGSGSWGTASEIDGSDSVANATGTLIQSANTVGSAKTKVGGTMLYKDNAGTTTLGTDLKIYFTCDGGSNWTEASSYSAITPVYSTGIKQVRLGETTCTSGTDIRYKAVWANQASGSKETQLHGIGINY